MNANLNRRGAASLLVAAAISSGACSSPGPYVAPSLRTDFTGPLRASWNFSDDEIRQLQFYTRDGMTLERDLGGNPQSIVRGKLVVRDGHDIEVIEIPPGTPGIATKVSRTTIDVCFEGNCTSTLTFLDPGSSNYPSVSGAYEVKVNDPTGNSGLVTYDGRTYILHPLTHLQIDTESLRRTEIRRTVPGKLLEAQPH